MVIVSYSIRYQEEMSSICIMKLKDQDLQGLCQLVVFMLQYTQETVNPDPATFAAYRNASVLKASEMP